jgi:hypothetical protein
MKILFKYAVALLAFGAVMSCQKDGLVHDADKVDVTFQIDVPEVLATKATTLGAGAQATQLYYAVYKGTSDEEGQSVERIEPMDTPAQPLTLVAGKAQVSLKLVKNYKYDIVFWAQAPGAPYAFDKDKATVTVTDAYAGNANDESRDAFFAFVDDYVVKAEATAVSLFRPFAQINFCTDDYSRVTDLNHTMTSTVEVAKAEVPSVLNLITGAVSIPVAVKFVATAVPAATGETIDVMVNGVKTTYSNVAMNYILASDESVNLTDMTATFNYNNDKVVVSVPNLPYQRNWRTNVFGSLFTVDAVFNIEVAPVFPNDHNEEYK